MVTDNHLQNQFLAKIEATVWDPKLEEEIMRLWESEKIYEFKPKKNKNRNFSIDNPPPYPSGKPWHPGALTQYAMIDVIARAARMRGLSEIGRASCRERV